MRLGGGTLAVGVFAAVIAAGCATAGTVSLLPTERSGTITQVAPIAVGTTFPTPLPSSPSSVAKGTATPVRAAAPRAVGGFGLHGDSTPASGVAGGGRQHGPGHGTGHGGGHGGSGSDHGGPVHTGFPASP